MELKCSSDARSLSLGGYTSSGPAISVSSYIDKRIAKMSYDFWRHFMKSAYTIITANTTLKYRLTRRTVTLFNKQEREDIAKGSMVHGSLKLKGIGLSKGSEGENIVTERMV
ncbi:hypothetical protein Q1695_014953 [Nippostrongylus brasiliensis]|nr:hypothetical protein Q1695_014953 [Nippostrongylus brasiliensis]